MTRQRAFHGLDLWVFQPVLFLADHLGQVIPSPPQLAQLNCFFTGWLPETEAVRLCRKQRQHPCVHRVRLGGKAKILRKVPRAGAMRAMNRQTQFGTAFQNRTLVSARRFAEEKMGAILYA